MIHPDTELRFISRDIGYGVVATRLIPRGTITWARDAFDQVFSPWAVERLVSPYHEFLEKYSFVDRAGNSVLCWDLARYVNHSCHASCLSAGYDFEIAVRDIQPGEELTDDYGTLNLEEDFPCLCGFPDCRLIIRPDDPLNLADRWDRQVAEVFPRIAIVEQPLWPFVEEKSEVKMALSGKAPVASCMANHYSSRLCVA